MQIRARFAGIVPAVVLIALAPLAFASFALPAAAAARTRSITRDVPSDGIRTIRVDIPAAEVRIRGVDAAGVTARLDATCDGGGEEDDASCRGYLDGLDLRTTVAHGRLRIELTGIRRHSGRDTDLTVTLEMPRRLALEVEMGAGDLNVADLRGDLRLKVGAGRVSVHAPESTAGSVDANVGIGDASVVHDGRRVEPSHSSGNFGTELHWSRGPGDASIEVRVGVGQAEVTLE